MTAFAALPIFDRASFVSQRPNDRVVTIYVSGDVDASNTQRFADYVNEQCTSCRWLVLDMSGVTFCGVEAALVLQSLDSRCTAASVQMTLVTSRSVSRVLTLWETFPELAQTA